MNRSSLIQFLINKYKYSTYLEIGTQKGLSFFPIRCKRKMAVDPVFLIDSKHRRKWLMKNPCNFRNKYFEMTSDEFFSKQEKLLQLKWIPDIVFIDGLHTYEATLNDILNSLRIMDKSGTIIIHDCFPPHKAAAEPGVNAEEVNARSSDIQGWTGEWCGDTWKAMAYLKEKFREELNTCVLNADYGLGVVQIQKKDPLDLAIDPKVFDSINSLRYEDLIEKPKALIGLCDSKSYKEL